MKYLILSFVLLFGSARCQSQYETETDTLYVKNSSAIAAHIVSADSFVVQLSDGRSARLTVLDSVVTENNELVRRLQQLFPGISVTHHSPAICISFAGADIPRRMPTEKRYLVQFSSFVYYYRQYDVPTAEMLINCQWAGLPHVAFQIGASMNLAVKDDGIVVSNGALVPTGGQFVIGQTFAGIGVSHVIGRYRGNLFFNAGERRISYRGPDRVANQILYISPSVESDLCLFISPSIEANFFDTHFRLSLGANLFMNRPSVNLPGSSSALKIGIGYRL